MDPGTLIALGTVLLVAVIIAGQTYQYLQNKRQLEKIQLEFFDAFIERTDGSRINDEQLRGEYRGRKIRIEYPLQSRLAHLHVELTQPVVPEGIKIYHSPLMPRRQEEWGPGGAYPTGDAAFDAKYLVYFYKEIEELSEDLRTYLKAHEFDSLSFDRHEASHLISTEVAKAFEQLDAIIDYYERLERACSETI